MNSKNRVLINSLSKETWGWACLVSHSVYIYIYVYIIITKKTASVGGYSNPL